MVVVTYLSDQCTLVPDLVVFCIAAELQCEILFVVGSLCGACSTADLDGFIVVYFPVYSKTLYSFDVNSVKLLMF